MHYLCLEEIETPAFIWNLRFFLDLFEKTRSAARIRNVSVVYPLKTFSVFDCLKYIKKHTSGFSVSSLFEARLAYETSENNNAIHFTSPSLRDDEFAEIILLVDFISFNSMSQWGRFGHKAVANISCGLRVNPQLSFIRDSRYNPCRKHSKLGVPLDKLASISNNGNKTFRGLKGLHFHTNCESTNFDHLLKTVKHLDAHIPRLLEQVEWVNMGGGYLFEDARSLDKFNEAVLFLKDKYDVEVFIEPGKGIVGRAGYIVSSVVDIFESDGKDIAVLDTTVNHMPEVFEYQYKPDIMQESADGQYKYILAGASCLAGDLFGEYSFDEPLDIGSRIVFENMGAYTLVKAHMFNGINLPSIYVYTQNGRLELIKHFTYEDYISRCGVNKHVSA